MFMKDVNQNSMPFFDMVDANDLYKKLEHDFMLLTDENPNTYNYMNFIFTANHLLEWVIADNNFDNVKKEKCKTIFGFVKIKDDKIKLNPNINKEFDTIKSLCNRSKHFNIKKQFEKDKVKNLGFDFANIDFSNFTFRGTTYYVEVEDKMIELYIVCKKYLMIGKKFFVIKMDYIPLYKLSTSFRLLANFVILIQNHRNKKLSVA